MSALNPNAQAPVCFIAPTLDGDWRWRVAINGWAPNVIQVDVDTALGSGSLDKGLGWVLEHLDYVFPIDVEVRKGSFGVFYHTLFFSLTGKTELIGPLELEWNDSGFLFDIGFSYELARLRLWDGARAPEITLEPIVGTRVIYDPVVVSILGQSTGADFTNASPIIGLRTFIDLTEHWNLEFEGDYGGFGVDDNHQTWQAVGLIGYRWAGWGVHWNLQVGYRAMRFFDLRRGRADVVFDGRGANIVIGVDF